MSRVITFSRYYPKYHPKAGQPTWFVEKIMRSLHIWTPEAKAISDMEEWAKGWEKHHTIRAGNRWAVGNKFSPRVWSGKPYASKQIIIAPDIEIKKVLKFTCTGDYFYLNDKQIDATSCDIPKNDGLETEDFLNWFPNNRMFTGQLICWSDEINYV